MWRNGFGNALDPPDITPMKQQMQARTTLYYSFTGDGNYLLPEFKIRKAVFNLMEEDCVDGDVSFLKL